MKITKPLIIAVLAAGNLLMSDLALQAQGTTNSPLSPPASAPPPGRPPGAMGMRGGPNVDMMAQQLNLTDDQKPKFKSIMETRMQKMRDLRQDPDFAQMTPQDRGAKIKAIQDDTDAQIKALLTPEQLEKWHKMRGMRVRPMGTPSGGPNAGTTNAPPAPPYKGPQN